MFIKEYNEVLSLHEDVFKNYNMDEVVYFDIETTGFDKEEDSIILISMGKFKDNRIFSIKQYFAENLEDEKEILHNFKKDIVEYKKWCSYNGMAFDEPFIKRRMEKQNVMFDPPKYHVDLYRLIRPYYKQMGMERCNLKTVEKYISIEREDQIDGGMSVDLYKEFLLTSNEKLKETIMLHNYEDVLSLPKIHELAFKVENDDKLVRKDVITKKQSRYLKSLLNKNNIILNINLDRISKKAGSRAIDSILKGCLDCDELNDIISNSY
jgi:uncharacterized protein YprB with RNaseH-like and TPR domain